MSSATGEARFKIIADTADFNTQVDKIANNLNTKFANLPGVKAIGVSIDEAKQKLAQLEASTNSLKTLQKNAEGAATGMNTLTKSTTATTKEFTNNTVALGKGSAAVVDLEKKTTSFGSKAKDVFGKGGVLAAGITGSVAGILSLSRAYRDYGDVQIAVDKAKVKVSKMDEAQAKAQKVLNDLLKSGTASSQDIAAAQLDVAQAVDKATLAHTDLGERMEDAQDKQEDMKLASISTAAAIGTSIASAASIFTGSTGKIGNALTGLKNSMVTTAGSFNTMKGALVTLGKGLAILVGFEVLGRMWTDLLQKGNPAIKSIHEFGLELEKLPIIGPILKTFGDIMNQVFLPDQWAKEQERLKGLQEGTKGVGDAAKTASSGVKELDNVSKGYIPTSKLFTESTRQIGIVGGTTEESYLRSAKAINFWGLEEQKSTKTSIIATEGFKKLAGGVSENTKAIEPNIAALKKYNITLFDSKNAGEQANKTSGQLYLEQVKLAGLHTEMLPLEDQLRIAIEKANKATADRIAKETDLKKIQEERVQMETDINKQMAENKIAVAELTGVENDLSKALGVKIDLMDFEQSTYEEMHKIVDENTNAFKKEELELFKITNAHKILGPEMAGFLANTKDDTTAIKEGIAAHLDWSKALHDDDLKLALVAEGHKQAALSMEEFVNNAITETAKTELMNKGFEQLGQTMVGKIHTTVPLTTQDFTELGKTFGDNIPLAEKLADIVEKSLAPAFNTFSSVIQAATKKDFKDAFKGLSLGDVGKTFKSNLKDILGGMNEIAKSGKEMATVVSGAVIGALQGMSDKGITQGIDQIVSSFNKFTSLDPDATIVQPLIDFVNNLPPEAKAAGLLAIHGGLEDIATAQSTGNITTEKATEILGKYNPLIDAYNKAIAAGKSPTEALATATSAIGTNSGVAAPKLDEVASALDSVKLAGKDVTSVISKLSFEFPPPKLDQVAQAFTDVGKAGAQTASDISKISYVYPSPNISKTKDQMTEVFKWGKRIAGNIVGIKYNFPSPNISKAKSTMKEAYDYAKRIVGDINGLKATIKVGYSVEKKPSGLSGPASLSSVPLPSSQRLNLSPATTGISPMMIASGPQVLNVKLINVNNDREIMRSYTSKIGRDGYKFGG
jgi:hypothetical protein